MDQGTSRRRRRRRRLPEPTVTAEASPARRASWADPRCQESSCDEEMHFQSSAPLASRWSRRGQGPGVGLGLDGAKGAGVPTKSPRSLEVAAGHREAGGVGSSLASQLPVAAAACPASPGI